MMRYPALQVNAGGMQSLPLRIEWLRMQSCPGLSVQAAGWGPHAMDALSLETVLHAMGTEHTNSGTLAQCTGHRPQERHSLVA
jgi:hypothetical protein